MKKDRKERAENSSSGFDEKKEKELKFYVEREKKIRKRKRKAPGFRAP